ncbi:MAG TPA: hypothetical protein VHX87_08580 [Galbitalea sp.]|nr:hypothetical protein [Galbitalea sp.]
MEPASTVYEAAIVEQPKPSTRRRQYSSPTLDDALKPGHPGRLDLVIRRKDNGRVIVRTPADIGSPDAMLTTVRNDLANMTADEFLDEWKMPEV